MEDSKTHREKLYNEHVVDKFLTRIADKSEHLSQLYEDKNGYVGVDIYACKLNSNLTCLKSSSVRNGSAFWIFRFHRIL